MAQSINVDMTPGLFMPTLHYSQGDVGREFVINLATRDGMTIPVGATVTMQATKPSGFGFSVTGTLSGTVATFTTTDTMTDEYGRFQAEIVIAQGTTVIGTTNFWLEGERNPHPEGTTDGKQETVIPELTLLVERVEKAASDILDMNVEATTLAAGSQATYSYDEDTNTATFGIPQGEAGAGAAGVVASAYSSSNTYAVGDYVIHNSNLYRCTTAITTAEAFTAGHWTQVVLGDDVSDLKSDLIYAGIPRKISFQDGHRWKYASATSTISDEANSGWRNAIIDCVAGDVFTLNVTTNPTSTIYYACGFLDSNNEVLPQLERGELNNFIVVAPQNATKFWINDNAKTKDSYYSAKLNSLYFSKLSGNACYIEKTSTEMTISIGKVQFTINKLENQNNNVDTWVTLNAIYNEKESGGYKVSIWTNSDTDGVVRISGDGDYIGGYHGNEIMTDYALFIDGTKYVDDSVAISKKEFNEVKLCISSNVYHYTSNHDGTLAFTRSKVLTFNSEGFKVENHWTASGNFTVSLAYFGMLSVDKYTTPRKESLLLNNYYTNLDFSLKTADEGIENAYESLDYACFMTKYGDLSIKAGDFIPADKSKGHVAKYTDSRIKTYFGMRDIALEQGDILRGVALIKVSNSAE